MTVDELYDEMAKARQAGHGNITVWASDGPTFSPLTGRIEAYSRQVRNPDMDPYKPEHVVIKILLRVIRELV